MSENQYPSFAQSGHVHSYVSKWMEDTQQWDIFLKEEECETYVCSFSKDEEADKNNFMTSSNGY